MKSIAVVCVVVMLAMSSSSGQQQPRVTGFFTDMRGTPSGDVAGTEVWIVYARGYFYATVQEAAGEPDPPVLVPVEVSGSRIKFTVRHTDETFEYTGTVTKAGLTLSLNGNNRVLKRGDSYWQ